MWVGSLSAYCSREVGAQHRLQRLQEARACSRVYSTRAAETSPPHPPTSPARRTSRTPTRRHNDAAANASGRSRSQVCSSVTTPNVVRPDAGRRLHAERDLARRARAHSCTSDLENKALHTYLTSVNMNISNMIRVRLRYENGSPSRHRASQTVSHASSFSLARCKMVDLVHRALYRYAYIVCNFIGS